MKRNKIFLLGCLVALIACGSKAQGTLDALTPSPPYNTGIYGPYVVGFFNGGVGWTFTPTSDLLVTGVSSLSAPQVSIWAGTNQILTTYSVAASDGSLEAIPPLLLFAGQNYAISTQNTNSSSTVFFQVGSLTGTTFPLITISSYLTGFGNYNLSTTGQWTPFGSTDNTDVISIGPNFQFQVVPEPGITGLSILGLLFCSKRQSCRAIKILRPDIKA